MTSRVTALGITLITWGGFLQAQQHVSIDAAVRGSDKPYVLATGDATISAKPDQAIIDVGVVTQGTTAASVATQNAKQTDAVLAILHKILAPIDQLKTTTYSVRPNYQTPKPGGTATIDGYTATNTVEIVLDDVAQVGKVIDAALQSGANTIQRLQFGLKNPQTLRSQALAGAAKQARANAEAIAAGLGVHVVQVVSAEESDLNGGLVDYQRTQPQFSAVAAPTQLEAGNVEVKATVTLKVEVAP
jgi:uncharacterized protein YggE